MTVNLSNNKAQSGFGGVGGAGGSAVGGTGGSGGSGRSAGSGGNATGGTGGAGGEGATGSGGGIFNQTTGTLTSSPSLGRRRAQTGQGHRHHHDQRRLERVGQHAGIGGGATAGSGGTATQGQSGATDLFSVGIGGGVATFGTAHADNTTITGNDASTNDNDVDGTITP